MTIDCTFGLGYLPILWSLFTILSFAASYCLSVADGHVNALLPSISDTGVQIPEANIFSFLMNISIILAISNYFTRYFQCQHQARHCGENRERIFKYNHLSLLVALTSILGALVVANVQSRQDHYLSHIHDAGAVIFFVATSFYFWLQTYISYRISLYGLYSPWLCHLRMLMSFLLTLSSCFYFATSVISYHYFDPKLHNHALAQWAFSDGAYLLHVASNSSEWFSVLLIVIFTCTYFDEFQQVMLIIDCQEKFGALINETKQKHVFDPKKLVHNLTDKILTDSQVSALMKGVKFGIPPKNSNETEVFSYFEQCYKSVKDLPINENLYSKERFKNKFAECAYSYSRQYNNKIERNLTPEEWKGLLDLKRDKDMVILKADKGNCTVLLSRTKYNEDIQSLLNDTRKFRKLDCDPTTKREDKLVRFLRQLKKENAINEQFYEDVRPVGSQPARLYGLPKIHKTGYPLRPICSSIGSYNYRLASKLASILSPLANNEFTLKNSFDFVKEIQNLQSNNTHLVSFEVSSLFTNVPLEQTIEITLDYAFKDTDRVDGLSKSQFKKLLKIATGETNFLFNDQMYDQVDGVAMGSPLAPVLASIFMKWFEQEVFNKYQGVKPLYYRRYVDDSFLIFQQKSHVDPLFTFMNGIHPNMKFTKEEENEGEYFSFLHVKITRNSNRFHTSTYYKPTHTGLYTHWLSYTPRKYKIKLIKRLLYRAWNICSDRNLFDTDVNVIKQNLLKNQFPIGLLDATIKNFIEKTTNPLEVEESPATVEKKVVTLVLPYYGKLSDSFEKSIKTLFRKAYHQVQLRVVFKTTFRLSDLYKVKDVIPKRLISNVVYGVYCSDCSDFYVGKTIRHVKKRFDEHFDIRKTSAVKNHVVETNHEVLFDNVKILARGNSDTDLRIKETLLIKKLNPVLNENVTSYPLEMF